MKYTYFVPESSGHVQGNILLYSQSFKEREMRLELKYQVKGSSVQCKLRFSISVTWLCNITGPFYLFSMSWLAHLSFFHPHKAFCLSLKDIQQLLQLQQLVLMPGHPLQSPAQFLLPQAQAQQGQQGTMRLFTHYFIMAMVILKLHPIALCMHYHCFT